MSCIKCGTDNKRDSFCCYICNNCGYSWAKGEEEFNELVDNVMGKKKDINYGTE